jgi:N-acetylmuramic acid 6-phosphate (MurNAc-6-P) etherase
MQITIQDLAAAAQLIDVATQRGAFKAAEASVVGEIFGKLSAFIQSANEQAEAAKAAEAATTEESLTESDLVVADESAAG